MSSLSRQAARDAGAHLPDGHILHSSHKRWLLMLSDLGQERSSGGRV